MESLQHIHTVQYDSSLNDTQRWVLAGANTFSSYLGLTASCWLLAIVYREREWFSFERIMAFSSICNILQCTGLALAPFMAPQEAVRALREGDANSCDAGGFFMQTGLTVPLYSASLSVYYLLRVRYEVDRVNLAQKYEWALHLLPIAFAYGTAIVGLIFDLYEALDLGLGCWVSSGPDPIWIWTFLGVPFTITIVTVVGCSASVFVTAQRVTRTETIQKQANRLYPVDITKPDPRVVKQETNQCILYAINCVLCTVWMLALRVLEDTSTADQQNAGKYYALILIAYFTYPLKGLADFFIFLRPAVLKKKNYDETLSTLRAFGQVLFADRSPHDLSHISFDAQSQSSMSTNPGLSHADEDAFSQSLSSFVQSDRSRSRMKAFHPPVSKSLSPSRLSPVRLVRPGDDSLRSIDLNFSNRQSDIWGDSILG